MTRISVEVDPAEQLKRDAATAAIPKFESFADAQAWIEELGASIPAPLRAKLLAVLATLLMMRRE